MIKMIVLAMLVTTMVGLILVAERAYKMKHHHSWMLVTASIMGLITSMVGVVLWVITIRL